MKIINKNNSFKALTILLLITYSSKAQTNTNTVSEIPDHIIDISFGMGPAIPLGNLANQNVNDPNAGLAKTGFDFRFAGSANLHKNFALCGLYLGQSFMLNAQSMANYFASQDPGVSYSVQVSNGWSMNGMFAGGCGRFPIDKNGRFTFRPKAMIGFASGHSPSYSVTAFVQNNGITHSATVEQSGAISQMVAAYVIGGGMNMNLNKGWFLNLNVDYVSFGSKAQFKDVILKDNVGNSALTNFDMEMRSVSITFGVGYRIGKRKAN